jgi:hypothetical protein
LLGILYCQRPVSIHRESAKKPKHNCNPVNF